MLPDRVNLAINTIYDAGYDQQYWQQGIEQLCAAINAKNAITVPRISAEDTLHLPRSKELDEFANVFVADGWYQRDLRAMRGWPLTDRGQRVVLEQDITTEEDRRSHPMYQELLAPFDQWWWGGITFRTPDKQYVLSVFRPRNHEGFTEDDRALFDVLSGHLARAVTIAERLGVERTRSGLETLSAVGEAAIVLDGAGRVLDMTVAAERLLGDGIHVVGRSLMVQDSKRRGEVDARIGQSLAGRPGHLGPIPIDRPGKRPLLLDVLPLSRRLDGIFLSARLIVLLVDLDRQPLPAGTVLKRVFGLSPGETRLALDLASGTTLSESAARHEVSRETARTQLKALFHKTGTNRQTDLIALLLRVARHNAEQP